ncbi:MAG: hypothetical protein ACPIOQ_80300, partial [Promethearchaeia archaeon]
MIYQNIRSQVATEDLPNPFSAEMILISEQWLAHVQRTSELLARFPAQSDLPPGEGAGMAAAGCWPGEKDEEPRVNFSRKMMDADAGFCPWAEAAGDFLLAAREVVGSIRGFAELPWNAQVDQLAVYAAVAHGYGQLIFGLNGCEIIHQEHAHTPTVHRGHIDCSKCSEGPWWKAAKGASWLHSENVCHKTLRAGQSANCRGEGGGREAHRWNTEDWGLVRADLAEVEVGGVSDGPPDAPCAGNCSGAASGEEQVAGVCQELKEQHHGEVGADDSEAGDWAGVNPAKGADAGQ